MSIAMGTTLGYYRIVSKLDASGMGQVYIAEDTKLHRKVALKVLPPEWADDPDRLERFQWEAQVLATLNHPNIVTIYSVEKHDGVDFFTMELVEGKTLADLIPIGGLPLEQLFDLAVPLADALSAAHQRGIIHRDVKPGNIMVRPDGQVKVLDFGLAKREETTSASAENTFENTPQPHTREGQLLGTIAYMSPEQIYGHPIDHRADVFSLGIVLFEMATGVRPFEAESWGQLISTHMRRKPPSVTAFNRTLPGPLERVIQGCLRREPKKRFQTMAELRHELERLRLETQSGTLQFSQAGLIAALAFRSRRRVLAAVAAAVAVLAVIFMALWLRLDGAPEATAAPEAGGQAIAGPKIVILPLENLGRPEDEYFAAGVTEEITSRLATVSALRVISRSTAVQYDKTGKTGTQIGNDLGVDYLLEGTVRWSPAVDGASRVRVTTQLIRVSDDTHVWAEQYDRVIDDIFAVQSTIAEEVIRQLDIALLEPERRVLTAARTQNLDAYEAYLRGMDYASRYDPTQENWQLAVRMFERAVELDPEFALAYAELSEVHSFFYHHSHDRSDEHLAKARNAVNRALKLDPHLPAGHRALGYYHYWGHHEYDLALQEFAVARKSLPNDSQLLGGIAFIRRRQGRLEEAVTQLEKAIEIDPRSAWMVAELARTYTFLRRYELADHYYDRSISLAPDQPNAYHHKAVNHQLWKGTTAEARATLERMPRQDETSSVYAWFRIEVLEGNYQAALARLRATPATLTGMGLDFAVFRKDFLQGHAFYLMGESSQAALYFEAAHRQLAVRMREPCEDPRLHSALGLVLAGLGHREEAVREGRLAVEQYAERNDAFILPAFVENLAVIYAMVGEHEAAIDQIEQVLAIPSELSVPMLRLDPRWDPLREHPRFRKLVDTDTEQRSFLETTTPSG
ncbi:MAG: protein kinase [bacterium]|nr:protein kinase [bacterium]